MRGFFARLLGRDRTAAPPAPAPPLSFAERRRIEREARALERTLARQKKALARRGCSTCPTAEDPVGVRLWKQHRAMRQELARLEARLEDA